MRSKIKKCRECSLYTQKEICPICGEATSPTKPARFSPEDPYGKYRRMLLREAG